MCTVLWLHSADTFPAVIHVSPDDSTTRAEATSALEGPLSVEHEGVWDRLEPHSADLGWALTCRMSHWHPVVSSVAPGKDRRFSRLRGKIDISLLSARDTNEEGQEPEKAARQQYKNLVEFMRKGELRLHTSEESLL